MRIYCCWVRESDLMMYKCKDKNAWEYICHQTYYLYVCTYLYHQIKTFIAWFIINLSFLLKVTKLLQCIFFNKIVISWSFLYQFLWTKDIFVAKKEYYKLLSYIILKFPPYTILYSIYYQSTQHCNSFGSHCSLLIYIIKAKNISLSKYK